MVKVNPDKKTIDRIISKVMKREKKNEYRREHLENYWEWWDEVGSYKFNEPERFFQKARVKFLLNEIAEKTWAEADKLIEQLNKAKNELVLLTKEHYGKIKECKEKDRQIKELQKDYVASIEAGKSIKKEILGKVFKELDGLIERQAYPEQHKVSYNFFKKYRRLKKRLKQ